MKNIKNFPLFTKTYDLAGWILDRTQKFPKSTRFTFGQRIDNLALDILESVVEARYTRSRSLIMKAANLKLSRLRILLRLATDRRYLGKRQYFHAAERLDEIGSMLGGCPSATSPRSSSPTSTWTASTTSSRRACE